MVQNGHCSNFFLGNIGQENLFHYIVEQKNHFLVYKNKKFKKSKEWHFSQVDNPWFWSKNGHFWTKTMGYPLGKNVILSTFWTSCFYKLESGFFVLQYSERDFPGLYCLKKSWNNGHFGPKLFVNHFGKMSILFYL